jgi:general secretion pathway protein L
MINDILGWWACQMRELVTAPLRRRDARLAKGLVIELLDAPGAVPVRVEITFRPGRPMPERPMPERFVLDEAGIARLRGLLAARKPRGKVSLRLPPALLLERTVVLPLLSERDPERVLRYEMDRLTPFDSAEVFWTWSIMQRDPARGRLCLRLSLIPKAGLAPLLALLERAGAVPTALQIAGDGGAPRVIMLGTAESVEKSWHRPAVIAAAAGCAMLACAAAVLPFWRQSLQREQVEQRIAALQPRVTRAEQLRRQIASHAADNDLVAAERGRVGDVLRILAEITDDLPDDAYLTDFTMRQGKLDLAGRAAAAARLIASLSAGPAVRNPAFAAPVTRADHGDADLFSIRAEAAP